MEFSAKKILIIFCLMFFGGLLHKKTSAQNYFFAHNYSSHPKNTPHNDPSRSTATPKEAEWTFLILIHASNNLESFAQRNIKDMMKWGSTSNVNILVDLHKAGDKSWRYKIEQGSCIIDTVETRHKHVSIQDEVLSTAEWAFTQYPAKKYAVIFWNHGYGCLEPDLETGPQSYARALSNNWRSPLEGSQSPQLHSSRAIRNSIPVDRSILFDDERNTYLSNEGLQNTLKQISERYLKGQKIDLIGMDACLMGMIEIANQIKDYAHYFVASEEFEFAHGWPYGAIIEKLTTQSLTAKELGEYIVKAYENYYSTKTSYFTQACIDLSKISAVKDNIDLLAQLLLRGYTQDPDRVKLFIHQARSQTLSFSLSDYIDINSLYQELTKVTQYALDNPYTKPTPVPRINQDIFTLLHATLTQGIKSIKEAVIENCAGRYLARAHGLSIYFPHRVLDPSYMQNDFAQTTQWPHLLAKQMT